MSDKVTGQSTGQTKILYMIYNHQPLRAVIVATGSRKVEACDVLSDTLGTRNHFILTPYLFTLALSLLRSL
jgi:hypothetical protein